jgi:hypothetical protein
MVDVLNYYHSGKHTGRGAFPLKDQPGKKQEESEST